MICNIFPSAIAFAGLSGTIFSNVSTKDVSVFAPSYLRPSVLKLPPAPGFIISANVTAIEMATAVVTRKNEIDLNRFFQVVSDLQGRQHQVR